MEEAIKKLKKSVLVRQRKEEEKAQQGGASIALAVIDSTVTFNGDTIIAGAGGIGGNGGNGAGAVAGGAPANGALHFFKIPRPNFTAAPNLRQPCPKNCVNCYDAPIVRSAEHPLRE